MTRTAGAAFAAAAALGAKRAARPGAMTATLRSDAPADLGVAAFHPADELAEVNGPAEGVAKLDQSSRLAGANATAWLIMVKAEPAQYGRIAR